MIPLNSRTVSRSLVIVSGYDHLTAIVSDGNGQFPSRCETVSIPRKICPHPLVYEELEALIERLEADLRESFIEAFVFAEFAVASCFQSIFEINADLCEQNSTGSSTIADLIWNHYYDHIEKSGMEQFHVSLVMPEADSRSFQFPNPFPLQLTSFATSREILASIIAPVNRVGLQVRQLLSISSCKAICGAIHSGSDYLNIDIGWRMSELTQVSAGRVCHLATIPLGMFHFANDIGIVQNLSVEYAIEYIQQFGFGFGYKSKEPRFTESQSNHAAQIKNALEIRTQEFVRFLSKQLRRHFNSAGNGLLIPLNFSGHRIPGLWELISLVFGTTCQTCPTGSVDFVPKFIENSTIKNLSSTAKADLNAAIEYVNLTLRAEAQTNETLKRFQKATSLEKRTRGRWLRELL